MRGNFFWCSALLLSVCVLGLCTAVATAEQSDRFVFISDLHLDPLADPLHYKQDTFCRPPNHRLAQRPAELLEFLDGRPYARSIGPASKYGRYECDSPKELVESAFAFASAAVPNPDFVVFGGDAPAHNLDANTLATAWESVYAIIAKSYPNVPIAACVGNNDLSPSYLAECGTPQLSALGAKWSSLGWIPRDQLDNFAWSGAYTKMLAPNLRLAAINTNLVSNKGHRPNSTVTDCGQLAWLDRLLSQSAAAGESVFVLGHIPPSFDGTAAHSPMWVPEWQAAFIDIVAKHQRSGVVKGMFFGHVHIDEFRLLRTTAADSPVVGSLFTSAAVSPIYDNNPAFRVFQYDASRLTILDFSSVFVDLHEAAAVGGWPNWRLDYSFRDAYGKADVTTESLVAVASDLANSATKAANYYARAHAHYDPAEKTGLCAMSASTPEQYNNCLAKWSAY